MGTEVVTLTGLATGKTKTGGEGGILIRGSRNPCRDRHLRRKSLRLLDLPFYLCKRSATPRAPVGSVSCR
jgi:hypothetical protein